MKQKIILVFVLLFIFAQISISQNARHTMSLCGSWQFEQTVAAWPPEHFTRTIPVPGLIDLAEPGIEQYDELFLGDQDLRYSWYRRTFKVPQEQRGKKAVLTILKSRFNTRVILNGVDLGTYMQASTPIECDLTDALEPDGENVLLVRVDDIRRNPIQSAYSMDIEQFTYIPGIWDEVYITFTGPIRIARALVLPHAREKKATVKLLLQNHDKKIKREFSLLDYEAEVSVFIREKKSRKRVSEEFVRQTNVTCQSRKEIEIEVPLKDVRLWSPDDPFLYEAVIRVSSQGAPSDEVAETFGMRDFGARGKIFVLNGEEIKLLGSNITLSRFFGDRQRAGLPWDRKWVKKLLVDIPKALRWNAFRMCIGLAPDFWYDLADEYGIMLQNEWPTWKNRGWNRQIEDEYTDWVWADGSHPSIVIWDAMNESRHDYIGNVIIPKLKKLDPTRIWDAGYMDEKDMSLNEMDEPHYYPLFFSQRTDKQRVRDRRLNYRFGKLFYKDDYLERSRVASVPQVVNEYGWMWLNRDGSPAFISKGRTDPDDRLPKTHYFRPLNEWKSEKERTPGLFEYFLGTNKDSKKNREFQAYYIQLQTEALRSRRYIAGVMSFCYLTFDRGYTGDWFLNPIRELKPGPTLLWQRHCFAPFAVFIDLEDGRYLKNPKSFAPGSSHCIKLFGVNDTSFKKHGELVLKIIAADGAVVSQQSRSLTIEPHFQKNIVIDMSFPETPGGYLLLSELTTNDGAEKQISRRYVRVGDVGENVRFPEYAIELPTRRP